jgi:hypothetical protein
MRRWSPLSRKQVWNLTDKTDYQQMDSVALACLSCTAGSTPPPPLWRSRSRPPAAAAAALLREPLVRRRRNEETALAAAVPHELLQ